MRRAWGVVAVSIAWSWLAAGGCQHIADPVEGGGNAGESGTDTGGSHLGGSGGVGPGTGGEPALGGGGFGGEVGACAPGYRHEVSSQAVCVACEAGEYCSGVERTACGPDTTDAFHFSGPDAVGSWDDDGDPATPCAEWSECEAFGAIGLGTATSDRECWLGGWTREYQADAGYEGLRRIQFHPSGDVIGVSRFTDLVGRIGSSGTTWDVTLSNPELIAVAENGDAVVATSGVPMPGLARLNGETGATEWEVSLSNEEEVVELGFNDDGNVLVNTAPDGVLEAVLVDFSDGMELGAAEPFVPAGLSTEQEERAEEFQSEVLVPYFAAVHDELDGMPADIDWIALENGDLLGTCTTLWETGPSGAQTETRYLWRVPAQAPSEWTFQHVGSSTETYAFSATGHLAHLWHDPYETSYVEFFAPVSD